MSEFRSFNKISRLSREIVITEKIDGTNAQIYIDETEQYIRAGSRKRWITVDDDHYGFAKWVSDNVEELMKLGAGRHFGEWWGSGIQRRYGLNEKRFSLFNVNRWKDDRPLCCDIVPELYRGDFDTNQINLVLEELRECGSAAAPCFMKPEGIVIYHKQGNVLFKKTLEKDEEHKSKRAA